MFRSYYPFLSTGNRASEAATNLGSTKIYSKRLENLSR